MWDDIKQANVRREELEHAEMLRYAFEYIDRIRKFPNMEWKPRYTVEIQEVKKA